MKDLYACSLSLSAADHEASSADVLLDGVNEAILDWVEDLCARRARYFGMQTGQNYEHSFDRSATGRQVPVDGTSISRSNLAVGGPAPARATSFEIRQYHGGGLFWRTRVRVASSGDDIGMTLQMGLDGEEFVIAPPGWRLRAPWVIRKLADRYKLRADGVAVSRAPQTHTVDNVQSLASFLSNPGRKLPVVLLSVENHTGQLPLVPYLAQMIADELLGIAWVGVLSSTATAYEFARLVGQVHSCYNGAIRIYWPGFVPNSRPDYRSLFVPDRMIFSYGIRPEERLRQLLLNRIASVAAGRYVAPAVHEDIDRRYREQEQEALRQRIQAAAQAGSEEIQRTANEIYEQQATVIRQLAQEIEDLKKRNWKLIALQDTRTEGDDGADEGQEETGTDQPLTVLHYRTTGKRRPVLDFPDDELSGDTQTSFLKALTDFPTLWEHKPDRFDKVGEAAAQGRSLPLWEFRAVRSQGQWVRVFFGLGEDGMAILLHAYRKRQNRLSDDELQTAQNRLRSAMEEGQV